MASSLGIGCRGSVAKFGIESRCSLSGGERRPISVMFDDHSRSRGPKGRIMAAAALTTAAPATGLKNRMSLDLDFDLEPYGSKSGRREGKGGAVDASDRVDKWMRDSVVEIVKNLREAPLLVQVFSKRNSDSDNGNGGERKTLTSTSLLTEKKAMEEDWSVVKGNWEAGETPLPEGLILVEELTDEEEKEEKKGREKTTKLWGIVVQGRWVGCGPVCYLLKTTRAGLGPMGPCCTHFCLIRVKNFRETVESQLKNVWLVQSQSQ